MKVYYRPILQTDRTRPKQAFLLAGGERWFDLVEVLQRGAEPKLVPANEIPAGALEALISSRAPIAGLSMDQPNVMGILNVTPDSFSDGGKFNALDSALVQSRLMISEGVQLIDIGGESTRPGAGQISTADEIERVVPIIQALRTESAIPISIDTRKSAVALAAIEAGATFVNDVSAMLFDPEIAQVCAAKNIPICLMHSQGRPETMQNNPQYENALLDVYDHLLERIETAEQAGIPRSNIVVDPGMGFGKTMEHNLQLLRGLSLFHSLGCSVLLGASRKKFIGTLSQEPVAQNRVGGSLAIVLQAANHGVQILRVHDTKETVQALRLAKEI